VVSVTDPYGRILGFLYRSRYFFFQVAPELYSRGCVDPVIHTKIYENQIFRKFLSLPHGYDVVCISSSINTALSNPCEPTPTATASDTRQELHICSYIPCLCTQIRVAIVGYVGMTCRISAHPISKSIFLATAINLMHCKEVFVVQPNFGCKWQTLAG
jgi:hypothetical protein